MKLCDDASGALVTVEFEPRDVRSFADSWPCFDGPDRVRFTFERSSGDLVDMEPYEFDGREASVMADEAWSYFEEQSADSFREWLQTNLGPQQLEELARHGADAGFPGLTYTSDCVDLYDRFEDEIRAALEEDAEALGYDCPEAFVATFNRSDMLWSEDGRRTLLVWYMAERTAREVTEDR